MSHSELSDIREYVADELRPRIPSGWDLKDEIPTIDRKLARPLVWLEYGEFGPLDGVPPAALAIAAQLDICIVTNRTDMRAGETAADDMVAGLYHELVAATKFYAITARKAVFEGAYYGWRVSLTVATNAIPTDTDETEE